MLLRSISVVANIAISSSTDNYLFYFCILATVNSAAVNIGAHISLWVFTFSSHKYPEVELLGQVIILFLHFSNLYNGEGNGNPLQYSCLENPMDGIAWQAAIHGVAESRTRLSYFTFTFHFHALEKEMATHSSVLAWRIQGTGEPGGLPSVGCTESDMTEAT